MELNAPTMSLLASLLLLSQAAAIFVDTLVLEMQGDSSDRYGPKRKEASNAGVIKMQQMATRPALERCGVDGCACASGQPTDAWMHDGWMDVLKETRKVIASRKPPHDVLEALLPHHR